MDAGRVTFLSMANILCIDQSEVLLTRRLVLEHSGYQVRTALNKAEALELLQQHAVDCVVARHDPPFMDGIKAAAEIRQLHPQLPIMLLASVPTHDGYLIADECLSNLDGPEALIKAVERILKKNGHGRLSENLQESMRLWKKFNELEKKTIEVMRKIRERK